MLHGCRLIVQKPQTVVRPFSIQTRAYTTNRLQRWAVTVLGHDFAIKCMRTNSFGRLMRYRA